jgi:phosphotransferase system enzyme I (PtsI)
MFPLISSSGELDRAREILFEEKESLVREGVPVAEDIPVGIMIEVPSAAMTADILAKKSDFFSIGTNDLIQYTLAVDRGNENVASLYQPYHPGILRLLETTVESAHDAGISVGLCGEMAADPISSLILLGLGLDELSMGAFSIPVIKRIIRSVTLEEAEETLAVAIGMSTNDEIDQYLREWMGKRFDFTDR